VYEEVIRYCEVVKSILYEKEEDTVTFLKKQKSSRK
jgi:hypothetical protein